MPLPADPHGVDGSPPPAGVKASIEVTEASIRIADWTVAGASQRAV